MFVTPALAQDATGGAPAGGVPPAGGLPMGLDAFLLPIILVVIFWFLIFRPQQKRLKAQQAMISAIRRGDTVVTNGGIVGKVTKVVDDNEVELQIADGVKVRAIRNLIADVRTKGEPVAGESP